MQGLESDPRAEGLDGAMEFAPHNMQWTAQPILEVGVEARFSGRLMSYGAMAETAEDAVRLGVDEGRYPGVMVNFDNTARRQWNPDVWYGSNPYTFHRWLSRTADAVADRPWDQRLIFINAWNEWAESAVLEPSQRFGRTFLLAARAALIG